jgi:predicted metalloprotease
MRILVLIAGLAVLLAAAACGGDDDTNDTNDSNDTEEVEQTIREMLATGPEDVDYFLEHSTDTFLEDFAGYTREECALPENVDDCVGEPSENPRIENIEVNENQAQADVTIVDGEDEFVLHLALVKQDGVWKIDTAESPEGEATATPDSAEPTIDPAKVEELFEDADTAVSVVDQFWLDHWSEFFTGSYLDPGVYGGYFGPENPPCGEIYSDGSNNAYYCPADDYIAWDWGLMTANFLDEAIGDSFVYVVIAHEWAHAIQQRLDLSLHSLSAELQADCLAGAAISGAEADGTLLIEPGDRGEIFQSLAAVADEVEWGDSEDHGSADERIEAYQLGEAEGVLGCLPDD